MPLTFAKLGEENVVKKVGGNSSVKKHLESLGFVVGASVRVVSTMAGNVIVSVKEVRVAISKEIALNILI